MNLPPVSYTHLFGAEKDVTIYKGAYKPVMIDKEGMRYKIVGKFVYSLDKNNQVLHDCDGNINGEYREGLQCKAELYVN